MIERKQKRRAFRTQALIGQRDGRSRSQRRGRFIIIGGTVSPGIPCTWGMLAQQCLIIAGQLLLPCRAVQTLYALQMTLGACAAVVGIMLASLGATKYFSTQETNIVMALIGVTMLAIASVCLCLYICKRAHMRGMSYITSRRICRHY